MAFSDPALTSATGLDLGVHLFQSRSPTTNSTILYVDLSSPAYIYLLKFYRITELEGALKGHLVQLSCNEQGHPQLHQVLRAPSSPTLGVSEDGATCAIASSHLFTDAGIQQVHTAANLEDR